MRHDLSLLPEPRIQDFNTRYVSQQRSLKLNPIEIRSADLPGATRTRREGKGSRLLSRVGSSRLRSLLSSGCARRQVTRDVALAACVESAYARPRYAICANVLIAALSGEHKRQKQRRPGPLRRTDAESRDRAVRVPRAHACVSTRAGARTPAHALARVAPRLLAPGKLQRRLLRVAA